MNAATLLTENIIELMLCRCPSPADWAITGTGFAPVHPLVRISVLETSLLTIQLVSGCNSSLNLWHDTLLLLQHHLALGY